MTTTNTLAEAFPKEQARCRVLLDDYRQIGPAGHFAIVMIESVLRRADQAAVSGDTVAMLRSFDELQGCE